MIIGIGTDLLQVARIREMYENTSGQFEAFFRRSFTLGEQAEAAQRPDPVRYYAGRFAGKEAVVKCLELDGSDFRLEEIEILTRESGKPTVTLSGKTQEKARNLGVSAIQLSLSHETDYTVAFAVAEG